MPVKDSLKKYSRFLESMPVVPAVAAEVLFMVGDASPANYETLERKLALDPGLSLRLLKIANSAAYGRSGQVGRVSAALSVIGLQTARSLIMLVIGARLFDRHPESSFLKDFWAHTLLTAFYARSFALRCSLPELGEDAFSASMVFHLGEVSFWFTDRTVYEALLKALPTAGRALSEAEKAHWGFDHRELGAALLEGWDFPQALVDVAREHGKDHVNTENKRLVRIVSVASAVARTALNGEPPASDRVVPWMQEFALTPEEGLAWRTSVGTEVRQDPLFQVCQDLLETRR